MKSLKTIIAFCSVMIFAIQGCTNSEQIEKQTIAQFQEINIQISLMQTVLDNLLNTDSISTIRTDTAATVIRLDSLPERTKDFETIKFRLKIIEESLKNMNGFLSDRNSSNVKCHWEIVGWYSCHCAPPDVSGGSVHCDLCPIKKWVCN
jgi:uncharacterized lipoprotein YehR (DUF1307 family)